MARRPAPGAGGPGDGWWGMLEDEEIVEAVQRGVRSRLYERGRYSPTQEVGVHHFHRLLAGAMGWNGDAGTPKTGARPGEGGVR